jgi:hypothetical protein
MQLFKGHCRRGAIVGYFYAFDIAWFAFFSFPEHLVFALRALPVAIGASVAFAIAFRFSPMEQYWTLLEGKSHWFAWGWFVVLVLAALLAFSSIHFGLGSSFLLIAAGTAIYHHSSSPPSPSAKLLYWATTLMVLCLMSGFVSGNLYKLHKLFPIDRCISVSSATPESDSKSPPTGHVIFSGTLWVLSPGSQRLNP